MDIFRFINSRDVREHLEKLNYQFSTPEAAWLVSRSDTATMQERFDAWEEIIATMPDCTPLREVKTAPDSSFLMLLREHIDLQKKKLEVFFSREDAIYQYSLDCVPSEPSAYFFTDRRDDRQIFPDAESCLRECVEWWQENDESRESWREDICGARLIKRYLRRSDDNGDDEWAELEINKKGEPLRWYYNRHFEWDDHLNEVEDLLDKMWFAFPTPFRRGDILVDTGNPCNPFVLHDIAAWDSEHLRKNGFTQVDEKKRAAFLKDLREHGDSMDMVYYAWFCGMYREPIYTECGHNYMNLEYYRKPLAGSFRVLQPISSFLKEWVGEGAMDVGLLCNACHLIWQQEQCRDFHKGLSGYTPEVLRDYGVPVEKPEKKKGSSE